MSHSLRARLSGLRYKKIISDKDYDRLYKALDNEGVLDKIRAEIIEQFSPSNCAEECGCLSEILDIIDRHIGEGSKE